MNTPATHTGVRRAAAKNWAPTRATSTKDTARSFDKVDHTEDDSVTAAADDPAEYNELYRLHYDRVLRLCRLLLSDPHEADDVTQEVFIKLFQARQTEERAMVWAAWLTRVAVNACRDRRRSGWWKWWRDRHTEFTEATVAGTAPTPEQAALSNETRQAVWQSFRTLSARQQEIFVLRQLEGWSTNEVAEALGLSPGSIKRHLFRAVHQMRKALGGRQ
jgi:RNA polymerase sigma-70 factor (ECF subfamily)